MADTFVDMAADSPVPVLSGTHSIERSIKVNHMISVRCWFIEIKDKIRKGH